ncbi:hypothetical protein K438DRAFT_1781470 [Mycena galopus ATCC 62051]|nr:hypothetical protein K438DRAFT_1781470 [Mycena galopus ATCC 62051]
MASSDCDYWHSRDLRLTIGRTESDHIPEVSTGFGGPGVTLAPSSSATTMPRIKPHVPVRTHYSKDLKQRVIYQRFTLGYKPTKIAIHLNIPLRVVQRVITTWKEIGEVARDRTYIGRAPMLSPEHIKVIHS